MILDTVKRQIAEAMKARDELRVSTLKMLSSALHYKEINKRDMTSDDNKEGVLTEQEEIAIVRKEAKKRKDAIELYERALRQNSGLSGVKEKAERERQELKILQEYLPEELSNNEVAKMVDEAIGKIGAKGIKDMGKVIGMVMAQAKGNVDGKKAAEMVKDKLT